MSTPDPSLIGQPEGFTLSTEAVAQASDQFLGESRPWNVVGYGQGVKWTNGRPTGNPALLVFVTTKVPTDSLAQSDIVPPAMNDGTATDVVAVGHLAAQPADISTGPVSPTVTAPTPDRHTAATIAPTEVVPTAQLGPPALIRRMRPCPAGFSIGNIGATAGTLAGVVYDFLPGATVNPPSPGIGVPSTYYVLSNNHVLAATNAATVGSPTVQPGRMDGGQDPQDRIGALSRFVPIQLSSAIPLARHQNTVDCAISTCQFQDATREIYFHGAPRGWRRISGIRVGDLVRKTGRTTNTSFGRILATHATVDISYGQNGTARFSDQILTTGMSAGGDSGSLVTTLDNVVIGLLFAGSAQVTVINYFEHVRSLLRVEIAEQVL